MPPDAASSSPHENTGLCARYRPCFVFKGTVPRCTTTFVHHRKSDRCPCVAAASPMTQLRPLHNAMTACRCPKPRTATLSNPIGFPKGFALWPPEAAPRTQVRSGLQLRSGLHCRHRFQPAPREGDATRLQHLSVLSVVGNHPRKLPIGRKGPGRHPHMPALCIGGQFASPCAQSLGSFFSLVCGSILNVW